MKNLITFLLVWLLVISAYEQTIAKDFTAFVVSTALFTVGAFSFVIIHLVKR